MYKLLVLTLALTTQTGMASALEAEGLSAGARNMFQGLSLSAIRQQAAPAGVQGVALAGLAAPKRLSAKEAQEAFDNGTAPSEAGLKAEWKRIPLKGEMLDEPEKLIFEKDGQTLKVRKVLMNENIWGPHGVSLNQDEASFQGRQYAVSCRMAADTLVCMVNFERAVHYEVYQR